MGRSLFACFGRGSAKELPENAAKIYTANSTTGEAEEQKRGGPVLVELFTSQGCTTSPEAEILASRLGQGDLELEIPVIILAYHVEYWDYLGWKDPFGSSLWTVRQKAFVEALKQDTIYTPQVVIQGRSQCLGTDEAGILSLISNSPRFAPPTMQATFQRPSPENLQVSLTGALRTKVDHAGVDVMVALYESGLVTDCSKGENRGKVLTNDFVVRRLEKLCSVKDISAKKTVTGTVNFALWEGFNSSKCGIVVFVHNKSLHTFGSQQFQLPENI